MKTKRITVVVTEKDHRIVKSHLAKQGKTIADWVREQIIKLIKKDYETTIQN